MRLLTWACLALPAAGVLELAAHVYFAQRAPTAAQWQEAGTVVSRLRENRELVVIAPAWAEPNARAAFGEALMPLADIARASERAYPSAIEVSVLGQDAPAVTGWKTVATTVSGKFRFRTLTNPTHEKPLFDFVDELSEENVAVDYWVEGVREACRFNANARVKAGGLHGAPAYPAERFQCPGGEWFFVGLTIIEDQAYLPRRCVWSHPGEDGPLTIAYRDVPLGDSLEGHAGMPYFFSREGKGAPVQLAVSFNDTKIGDYTYKAGSGWSGFRFDTTRWKGQRGRVTFEVTTTNPDSRQFCWHAHTLERP